MGESDVRTGVCGEEGIKREPLGLAGAFVVFCRGPVLPNLFISRCFLEKITFFLKVPQKAAAPCLGHTPVCGKEK